MDLPTLANPPPPAEPLGTSLVSQMFGATAGELTISLESRFIPDRVGSSNGTTSLTLFGQLQPERMHPGSDFQACEPSVHSVKRRVRLASYRWLISDVTLEPPSVTVAIDRVAHAPKFLAPALETNDSCTFWLSTLGVDELAFENRANPILPIFDDYVEVKLYAYDQSTSSPWQAYLYARRVLRSFDNASWELLKIPHGATPKETVRLGDHTLELLEVAWSGELDVHARFKLTRGTTAEGMTKSPPPKPWSPPPPR